MKEMLGGCCVCSDDRGWSENPLVYCDGHSCTVAVHQACYGIVTVPVGPWFCSKCENQDKAVTVKCELCPSRYGAFKKTDKSAWVHVVCALYIPEVSFGDVATMEPIQLSSIPADRYNKVCYICSERGKPLNAVIGACMKCIKAGCRKHFHVTCAHAEGLLCEKVDPIDNVSYCGFCRRHYSKLKKGSNIKFTPPFKPILPDNYVSDSDEEAESDKLIVSNLKLSGKRGGGGGKSKAGAKSKYKKSVHSAVVGRGKGKRDKISGLNIKSAKNNTVLLSESVETIVIEEVKPEEDEEAPTEEDVLIIKDIKTETDIKVEVFKETKINKKRKNSLVPVPTDSVIPASNLSVVIPELSASILSGFVGGGTATIKSEASLFSDTEIIKKPKTESIQPSAASSPIVSTDSLSTPVIKSTTSSPIPAAELPFPNPVVKSSLNKTTLVVVSAPSASLDLDLSVHSIVFSSPIVAPVTAVSYSTSPLMQEQNIAEQISPTSLYSDIVDPNMAGGSGGNKESGSLENSGGLKITYEKHPNDNSLSNTEFDHKMSSSEQPLPVKRSRSMSSDKTEKTGRGKKRGGNTNNSQYINKRAGRLQHETPSPQASSIIPANQIKESPPSSPSSESQSTITARMGRGKGRKGSSATATATTSSATSSNNNAAPDSKDELKIFQNGITAPHMLGNQLNPKSNMAQKMTDHLNSELEAHSIFNPNEQNNLVGPQLHHRVLANARSSSTGGSSTASGGSGFSMLGGSNSSIPQTLDQLLERQWEQGSQFLMEQAQHFDIASLLSCLHQLRAENLRLEEHVSSLLQRRDHLLAVNARLAIPLTGQPIAPQVPHPHTVNNIHPATLTSHSEGSRSRHSSSYQSHTQVSSQQHTPVPIENGLPTEIVQPFTHLRTSSNNQQSQQSSRHSPVGQSTSYSGTSHVRQGGGESSRSGRSQSYPMYQGPGPSSAAAPVVMRREPESHQSTGKPS